MAEKLAAIYARQSKDKRDSVSIEAQIEKCAAFCTFKGKEYKVYHDKGYSGKNTDRPDYSEIMEDIDAGLIDEVVVYKVDRISRNIIDFSSMIETFQKHGVSFVSATEFFDTASPMGRAMMYLLMVFAQLERENTAERIKDNAMYRATMGRWTGGPVPFGYNKLRVADGSREKSILIPNEYEAKIIRQIFDWYLENESSVRKVVYKLNLLGIKTKDGAEWQGKTVVRILENLLYATNTSEVYNYFKYDTSGFTLLNQPEDFDGQNGMMYYRKRGEEVKKRKGLKTQEQFVIVGEHKGIIVGPNWVAAQEKMTANKSKAPREMTGKSTFLSGIVRCGICNSPMIAAWSGNTVKHNYLKCRRKTMKGKFLCSNTSMRVDALEKAVYDKIVEVCGDREFIEKMITDADVIEQISVAPLDDQMDIVKKRISEKELEIENLINNLKNLSSDTVTKRIEKEIETIEEDIRKLKKEFRRLQSQAEFSNNLLVNKKFLIDNYVGFPDLFRTADLDEKQTLIRGIIRDIEVDRGNVKINFF